ncbi:hypothetical protein LOZ57_005842 [Ophidiomyces ophidiicola]|uniref:uncharacterized protein n=1 Tax=Ophidiomyces ophidiicola TaxID=1387563 RepID=UPI0020C2F75F|nr:uncharacterized protein LOZ57_005842 [Ophidiomyces ophidiicola]KAI1940907.1 hypothetical protein LOZ57_005842 [Ophidiomyces ophidiicola]
MPLAMRLLEVLTAMCASLGSWLLPFIRQAARGAPSKYTISNQKLSPIAILNKKTLGRLQEQLMANPELDLLSIFPSDYRRQMQLALSQQPRLKISPAEIKSPPDFRDNLSGVDRAEVVFPLSERVTELLKQYSLPEGFDNPEQTLLHSLKQLLWKSPKLWENVVRGIVVKCSDDIVIKLLSQRIPEYTEYTTLQYLAERLPDIPVPRPHGLIRCGRYTVIFMSYIPCMTLTQAWPKLSHEAKLSVQHQLDDILNKLRTLRQEDGLPLGGVRGEGVKYQHWDVVPYQEAINSAAAFDDFRFSIPHRGSKSYIRLLRSLWRLPTKGSVFTHGDIRRDNVIIEMGVDNTCRVTGLIDWEDSGYYPEYFECMSSTITLSSTEDTDWYDYFPPCISPSNFPVPWLIDRFWNHHMGHWRTPTK